MSGVVYTVGYGKMQPAELLELAEGLDVTVIDIRGKPVSRRAGFGGRQLERLLGLRYRWRGNQLGGVFHLPNARELWPKGCFDLAVEVAYKGLRPLLLCQCHAPGQCHRHMVATVLLEQARYAAALAAIRVVHLFDGESVDSTELARSLSADDDYEYTPWESPSELRAAWE